MVWEKRGQGVNQRLSKFQTVVFFGFLICAAALWLWQLYIPKTTIYLAGEELHVLVAKIPKHQHKGLGGRESLGRYDGMLFVFYDPYPYGVVMRDMEFPLDIIWFRDGEVVDYAPNVPIELGVEESALRPYRPRVPADMFLELPAGWIQAHDLKIGDMLSKTPLESNKVTSAGVDTFFYYNQNYHFSMNLPKQMYYYPNSGCTVPQPVETTTVSNTIQIGSTIPCPDADGGTTTTVWAGWTVYAAKNIASQEDAAQFIKTTFGEGCEVVEWTENGFLIGTKDDGFISPDGGPDTRCSFLSQGKSVVKYSSKHQVALVWSLTQEPQFYTQTGSSDEAILASFRFEP